MRVSIGPAHELAVVELPLSSHASSHVSTTVANSVLRTGARRALESARAVVGAERTEEPPRGLAACRAPGRRKLDAHACAALFPAGARRRITNPERFGIDTTAQRGGAFALTRIGAGLRRAAEASAAELLATTAQRHVPRVSAYGVTFELRPNPVLTNENARVIEAARNLAAAETADLHGRYRTRRHELFVFPTAKKR